ncbi:unnamed protein product [Didymodactylos carnosus]|uniref:CYTH domain-containing protein n=1 Tax=Didymodactylos carnosus TaxID=1234261 RepID=A0A814EQA9_9BILA|nr:unnamed protein product [Didymodactylos carnosus]CAF0970460.1 unnamed protein product [Didymodactylos carnosus]CAF3516618.1 unnamed protein product [Didymodactylos carnosus]CAF3743572.1 unnamed protein product [Didymodactylos carnosus]
MPRNVEVKTKLDDVNATHQRVKSMTNEPPIVLKQCDYFFNSIKGRLKLRVQEDAPCYLIYYERPNVAGPKLSDYSTTTVTNPDELKETLDKALGIRGKVQKKRTLYMIGQTRVHIDEVHGLGDYLELEVVLRDDETVEYGERIAQNLIEQLNIPKYVQIECAYMDLLDKNNN